MDTKVETYSDKYRDDVVRLIKSFHEEALNAYGQVFDPDELVKTIQFAQHENAHLLIIGGRCEGILYGMQIDSKYNNVKMFQEVVWYINKEHRRYGVWLLRQVEKILKSQGFSIMIMTAMENSKSDKLRVFYTKLGYKPIETNYMRSLDNGICGTTKS